MLSAIFRWLIEQRYVMALVLGWTSAPATLANTHLYANKVHPTPHGYRLLAQWVVEKMALKGWL